MLIYPPEKLSKASFIKDNAVKETERRCWKQRKAGRKRQVVSFPFLPGRRVGGPEKVKLLL